MANSLLFNFARFVVDSDTLSVGAVGAMRPLTDNAGGTSLETLDASRAIRTLKRLTISHPSRP